MSRDGRRRQLLDTAREIITNEGIGALTMAGLSERAGISKPVVYDHFENSDDVIIAVLVDYHESLAQFALSEVAPSKDLGDFFDRSVDANIRFRSENRFSVLNITNGFTASERINQFYWNTQKRILHVYRSVLEQYGLSGDQAKYAAFALKELTANYVVEFSGEKDTALARKTLKAMIRGALSSLVSLEGPSPVVPPLGSLAE